MFTKKSLIGLFLFFLLVGTASAQMMGAPASGKMPRMFGEFKIPEVGSYAEYKLTYPAEKVEVIARMSIVGKGKGPEGKELFWYEYQTTNPKSGSVDVVKMLISGDPQKSGNLHRMIMKHNKDKAMELPAEMIKMINAPMKEEKEKEKGEIKNLGKETLNTLTGNLECAHMQYVSENKEVTDVWQTKEIPFFGLAKSVTQGMSMEVQKFGKDAKSAITEEPETFQMPGMEGEGVETPKLDTLKKSMPK